MEVSKTTKEKTKQIQQTSDILFIFSIIIGVLSIIYGVLVAPNNQFHDLFISIYIGFGVAIIMLASSIAMNCKTTKKLLEIDNKLEQINKKLDDFS